MMLRQLTVGYTSYRQETLAGVRNKMQESECVVLEEPVTPGFEEMLRQEMSIEDYLMLTDFGFPGFARKQCSLLQDMYSQGIAILQIEPFLDELVAIHEFFASGGRPVDIPAGSKSRMVYDCERTWTSRLLSFYKQAQSSDFFKVIRSVQAFARADARKEKMRDTMRAEALQDLFGQYESLYVEAGYIHFTLLAQLHKILPPSARLKTFYSLQGFFRSRTGRRQLMGPGDTLTLIYTWKPEYSGPRADLLAARSLIYNKVFEKEELADESESFPQSSDEISAVQMAECLNLEQCAHLYPQIRSLSTGSAVKTVHDYLLRIRQ